MDKDVQDKLVEDVAGLKTDMTWIKKMLGNHFEHHEKIIIGLIISVFTTASALLVVLLGKGL